MSVVDFNQRIELLRSRIQSSESIDPADQDARMKFSDKLRFRKLDYSDGRHVKLLQQFTVVAGDSERYTVDELPDTRVVDALHDEDAAKGLVRWIHRDFENEGSGVPRGLSTGSGGSSPMATHLTVTVMHDAQ